VTRTEYRLTDALAAVASRIPEDSLHPLVAERPSRASGRRWAWHTRWLPSALAAAAVLLVIALAVAIPGVGAGRPFTDSGTGSSPPPFYVSVDWNDQILVHSTSTGHITAITPTPSWHDGGDFADTAVSADPSGRMFAVAMNDWDGSRTRIFTFSLTSSGQISGLATSTIRVPGLTSLSAALSPDGNELALAGIADTQPSAAAGTTEPGPPRLLVVNLRTGHIDTWAGPARSGGDDLIQDPTWSANGRALYFLVTHCRGGRIDGANNSVCPYNWPAGQEWIAVVPPGTDSLTVHRASAELPSGTSQAVVVPGPNLIVLSVARSARSMTIGEYTVGGKMIRTLYTGMPDADLESAHLSGDGSGRYVILNEDRSTVLGWISNGKLRKLSIRGPFGFDELLSNAW
jgi:hypothetical protein